MTWRILAERGAKLRNLIAHSRCLGDLETEVVTSYWKKEERFGGNVDVAVRSSATTEDLPAVSFAGQQTSYLNVRGEGDLTERVMDCFASLLANRAISYRVGKGFDHLSVYLPVGVQKMVRSDLARARAMFSVDTDSGFRVRFSGTNQVILS